MVTINKACSWSGTINLLSCLNQHITYPGVLFLGVPQAETGLRQHVTDPGLERLLIVVRPDVTNQDLLHVLVILLWGARGDDKGIQV